MKTKKLTKKTFAELEMAVNVWKIKNEPLIINQSFFYDRIDDNEVCLISYYIK
jgi:hypothetical protein